MITWDLGLGPWDFRRTGDAFSGDELKDKKVAERIKELAGELVRYGEALGR